MRSDLIEALNDDGSHATHIYTDTLLHVQQQQQQQRWRRVREGK